MSGRLSLLRIIRVSLVFAYCHVGTLGACFAVHPSNWLLRCKLEVWEWAVKRRIFDAFSEFSVWI